MKDDPGTAANSCLGCAVATFVMALLLVNAPVLFFLLLAVLFVMAVISSHKRGE